jgi:hypothetical protein
MDWIERIFHVSPDGGSGLTEAAISVGAALAAVAAFRFRRARGKRAGR